MKCLDANHITVRAGREKYEDISIDSKQNRVRSCSKSYFIFHFSQILLVLQNKIKYTHLVPQKCFLQLKIMVLLSLDLSANKITSYLYSSKIRLSKVNIGIL